MFIQFEYRLAKSLLNSTWLAHSPRKHRLTMRLFRRCANAGHIDALSRYGHLLFQRGASPQDKAVGARCVVRAAEAGDTQAQYQAGMIYEHGCAQYMRRDDRAVTWYARAAEAGHLLAAQRLAKAYRKGELGLPVDEGRAAGWDSYVDAESSAASSIRVPATARY
ncbi:tetratricopeptide repeat protein [Phytohalomonas tamaricis]|uniref:tetratricopeptide repeat protein n=1 Tax=Phytohalomonas tamaricis TaxID=2081032 RepID=UPI0021D47174|nr:sel1 repeat family protein [Phytohalomonas tamaricis]